MLNSTETLVGRFSEMSWLSFSNFVAEMSKHCIAFASLEHTF